MKYILLLILMISSVSALDLDNDTILDNQDNCLNYYNPLQIDSDNDGFGNLCDGDFDNNGAVGLTDLSAVLNASQNNPSDSKYDVTGDEYVSLSDVSKVLNWSKNAFVPESGMNCQYEFCPSTLDNFTIVVLPDTQYYTTTFGERHFINQTNWIVNNKETLNIKMVLHEGDIVGNSEKLAQWNIANQSIQVLDDANVPYILAVGNHDGLNSGTREMDNFDNYFPLSRVNKSHVAYSFDGTAQNTLSYLNAGNKQYLIFSLEYAVRHSVLEWAKFGAYLHPNHTGILLTHSYTFIDGTRHKGDDLWGVYSHPLANNYDVHSGEDIGNELVDLYNFDYVFSGHLAWITGGARQSINNSFNYTTHEMLADYQGDEFDGGDGYLRIIKIVPNGKTYVSTYSPSLDNYLTDDSNQFILE